MGLKTESKGVIYLKLREIEATDDNGKTTSKFGFVKGDEKEVYSSLEGYLKNLHYRTIKWKGSELKMLSIQVEDRNEGDVYQFDLGSETQLYESFAMFIKSVDVTKLLCFHPILNKETRDGQVYSRRALLLSQDGNFAKKYFTKDDSKGLPKWEVGKVGTKTIVDKTAYLNFLERMILTEVAPLLNGNATQPSSNTTEENFDNPFSDPMPKTESDDKLPWE